MRHHGWTNAETYAVASWIDNQEDLYNTVRKMASISENKVALAEYIEAFIRDRAPKLAGLWADLLTTALSNVAWQEIADSIWTYSHDNVGEED